jgi:hypothetical protein
MYKLIVSTLECKFNHISHIESSPKKLFSILSIMNHPDKLEVDGIFGKKYDLRNIELYEKLMEYYLSKKDDNSGVIDLGLESLIELICETRFFDEFITVIEPGVLLEYKKRKNN